LQKDTFANGQLGSKAYRVKFVVPIHAHLDPAHKGLMLLVEAARAEAVKETLPHGGWVLPLPRHGEFYMVSPIADLMRNIYIDNIPTVYK
jgi:hypothetical protein